MASAGKRQRTDASVSTELSSLKTSFDVIVEEMKAYDEKREQVCCRNFKHLCGVHDEFDAPVDWTRRLSKRAEIFKSFQSKPYFRFIVETRLKLTNVFKLQRQLLKHCCRLCLQTRLSDQGAFPMHAKSMRRLSYSLHT